MLSFFSCAVVFSYFSFNVSLDMYIYIYIYIYKYMQARSKGCLMNFKN